MKENILIPISGVIFIAMVGFVIFYTWQRTNPASQKYISRPSSLPTIFRYSLADIKGTSTTLDPAWNLYTNMALGISLEYPARQFAYGVLGVGENKDTKPSYDPYAAGDPFYQIVFSDGDSSFYVVISPSRSSDIDTWLKEQGKEYLSSGYEMRERVISGKKALLIRHLPVDQNPQEREDDIREHLVYIQDGVLYEIDLNFLKNEERERIFRSFRLLR